jgi:L-proline amide hydrolase
MELWSVGTNASLEAFPWEFRDMLMKHEVAGTVKSIRRIQQFNKQHLCRVQQWSQDLVNAFEALEADLTVYSTMYALNFFEICLSRWQVNYRTGPSEFDITGTMRAWTVVDDSVKSPSLLF